MSRYIKRQNPKNKLITAEAVETIMMNNGLHIKVNDISIYQRAFIHRSYLKTANREIVDTSCVPLQDSCNETYEFLGDTILGSVVGTYLYDRYKHENEGFLTKTRTKMVRGTTLGLLAKKLGFGEWVVISQHVENEGGRDNIRILEDLFEAFLAAIYLDNGSEVINGDWLQQYGSFQEVTSQLAKFDVKTITTCTNTELLKEYIVLTQQLQNVANSLITIRSNGYLYCQRFARSTYEKYIDIIKLIQYDDNYKDQLQTYFQKTYGIFPKWIVLNGDGKGNQKMHTIGVHDRLGVLIGVGKKHKKTDAEQAASLDALIYLGVIDKDHGEDFFR